MEVSHEINAKQSSTQAPGQPDAQRRIGHSGQRNDQQSLRRGRAATGRLRDETEQRTAGKSASRRRRGKSVEYLQRTLRFICRRTLHFVMAQFDVHRNIGKQRETIPYVVIVQSSLFDSYRRRV